MKSPILASLAAAAALATGLSLAPAAAVAAPQPSRTITPIASVPNSKCAPIGHLYNGLCFGYIADGKEVYNWLGTHISPAGPGWGLDYVYTTAWGSGRRATIEKSSLGADVGAAELKALGALTTYTPVKGSSNTDTAAVALVIREVMGDGSSPGKGQIIPGGLTVGGTVKKADRLAIQPSVYQRAQKLWDYASSHYAPLLRFTSPVDEAETGEEVEMTASLTWGDGTPIAGATIAMDYRSRNSPDPETPTMTGPGAVTTGANGRITFKARVAVGVPSRMYEAWATTSVSYAPAQAPTAWVPENWSARDADSYPTGPTRLLASTVKKEQTASVTGYITK